MDTVWQLRHHCGLKACITACVPSFTRLPADAARNDARSQHWRSAHHCMYPVFLMAPTRSEKTHARSLSVCPGGLQATASSTTSKTQHFCVTSSFFEVDNIKNEAFLRDFLIVRSWQHQKRSISARLPHCSKLTTSKTKHFCETLHFLNWTTSIMKQFCETASVFQFYNIKNKMNSARLPSRMESWVQSWQPRTNAFYDFSWFFHSTCRKYCACHEKVMPGHTKCCTCHAKSSEQTYRSDAPKCSLSQEISALTS